MWKRCLSAALAAAGLVGCAGPGRGPGEVAFRMHAINAESPYEGAGVMDVNRDGKPDIVCGAFWYQGPTWTRHFIREVPPADGYHLDFCDLPLDADGDGWTDFVSAAWHNKRPW